MFGHIGAWSTTHDRVFFMPKPVKVGVVSILGFRYLLVSVDKIQLKQVKRQQDDIVRTMCVYVKFTMNNKQEEQLIFFKRTKLEPMSNHREYNHAYKTKITKNIK